MRAAHSGQYLARLEPGVNSAPHTAHFLASSRWNKAVSYSLLCRWFRAAVLPLDRELETALFHRLDAKRCAVCGALFTPGSNRAKYCPECAGRMKRIKAAQRKRKQRAKCHALGAENPL